jgi:hypothetical protein
MERAFARGHAGLIRQGSLSPGEAAELLAELRRAESLHADLMSEVKEAERETHHHWKTGTCSCPDNIS